MAQDPDDKATVVLDLNALRQLKEKQESAEAELVADLAFGGDSAHDSAVNETQTTIKPLRREMGMTYFLEFKPDYFQLKKTQWPQQWPAAILQDLAALNLKLKNRTPMTVIFAYETHPQNINRLCAQLRLKYPFVFTALAINQLAPEKVKAHQSSAAAADFYLSYPFKQEELFLMQTAIQTKFQKKAG